MRWTDLTRNSFIPRAAIAGVLCLGLCFLPEAALATDVIFGNKSPLTRFIAFMTGIFAYMLVIVGVVLTIGGLVFGNDLSGLGRRAPLVVVAGAVLVLADTFVSNLFGDTTGYAVPPDLMLDILRMLP